MFSKPFLKRKFYFPVGHFSGTNLFRFDINREYIFWTKYLHKSRTQTELEYKKKIGPEL